jgi:hypothetical protein
MSKVESRTGLTQDRWLLLIHQLPAKPAYLRVKVWRRLQSLGAVAVKNAVYALPASEQAQEDFAWIRKEIVEGGGEAMICEARLIDGLSDQEARALFSAARDRDYEEIAADTRAIAKGLAQRHVTDEQRDEARAQLVRLQARLGQVMSLDFFGGSGRETAHGLLSGLAAALEEPAAPAPEARPAMDDLMGRVWVTRQGVHVDRIACAWLVRRFIDPKARFKFVPPRGYKPQRGELRFDMFEAEITHEGDRCSFEVLQARAGLTDPALQAIGEIVHDIDLKDDKFGRDETGGIKTLIAGLAMAHAEDEARIEAGSAIFDNLYTYFRKRRG